MTTPAPGPPGQQRLPLRRPRQGRYLAGVCAGLAAHLGIKVEIVRVAMAALALLFGAGIVLYIWLVATVPEGDPAQVAEEEARPSRLTRLVPRLRSAAAARSRGDLIVGAALLAVALAFLIIQTGADRGALWLIPIVILVAGAALAWSELDSGETTEENKGQRRTRRIVRVGAGVLLAIVGVSFFVARGRSFGDAVSGIFAGLAVLAGVAFVLAPLIVKIWRDLVQERAAHAREAERADIAAHLHDSVLQTLTLIRANSHDANAVAAMARRQERELRQWLYADRPEAGTSIAEIFRQAAAEIEDQRGIPIDVVITGEAPPSQPLLALVAAAKEAMVNAVRHGHPPISVYLEINAGGSEAFIRDRGEGFDPDDLPADRHGIKDSMIARLQRHGGTVAFRTGPGRGTEVHLSLPDPTPGEH